MRTLESAADREAVGRRISALSPNDQRRWGKMSVHEMICHLCDSYNLALGEKIASPATGFLRRTLVKWIALSAPMKWPRNVRTRPEMEQGVGGTAPTKFERDRARLLATVERFCGDSIGISVPHPIFGPLTRAQWLRWGYLHADHHLRQFGR